MATLCSIQLLQHLPPNLQHTVSCYGFATPAIGNDALAARVAECGWDARIRNYLSPGQRCAALLPCFTQLTKCRRHYELFCCIRNYLPPGQRGMPSAIPRTHLLHMLHAAFNLCAVAGATTFPLQLQSC